MMRWDRAEVWSLIPQACSVDLFWQSLLLQQGHEVAKIATVTLKDSRPRRSFSVCIEKVWNRYILDRGHHQIYMWSQNTAVCIEDVWAGNRRILHSVDRVRGNGAEDTTGGIEEVAWSGWALDWEHQSHMWAQNTAVCTEDVMDSQALVL